MRETLKDRYYDQAVKLYTQGMSMREVASVLKVPISCTCRWLSGLDPQRARKSTKCTPELMDEIFRLQREGLSCEKISAKLGLGHYTVYRWIAKFAEKPTPTSMSPLDPYAPAPQKAIGETETGETTEQKLSRLEKELKLANMKADLYKELIDVAQKKYGIDIIKKAGAKR